ncbi:MAG: OmpH family outer membrane protein [Desulfovibrio sp.]|nr:OmpH family outer membrane protein [Desulfovibrio sp.]
MRTLFHSFLCLLIIVLLQACEKSGQQTAKIGVVNLNRIMVDSDAGRAAAKYMESLQEGMRADITALQEAADGDKEKKTDQEALQKKVQQAYAKMQAEQQNVQSILNDVLHRTVDSYRKNNGYSMILFSDVVLSFDKSVDVTSFVTEAMNKEKVEFKPLPEPKESGTNDGQEKMDAKNPAESKDEPKNK